jgi:hypothetical protein
MKVLDDFPRVWKSDFKGKLKVNWRDVFEAVNLDNYFKSIHCEEEREFGTIMWGGTEENENFLGLVN